MADVRRAHVEEYLNDLEATYSAGTVRNRLAYVRRMFELAVERDYIDKNPCRRIQVSPPTVEEQRNAVREYALTEAEAERLLKACREPFESGRCSREHPPEYLYPLVLLLLRTGCRRGELVRTTRRDPITGEQEVREGLLWENVIWDESYIVVDGKTGPREVPVIDDDALDALREYQRVVGRTTGPVFCNRKGKPIGPPRKPFLAAVKRAGIGRAVRMHDLRHTVGTQLERDGVRQRAIQIQLGHRSHMTTQKYLHVDMKAVRDEVRSRSRS